MRPAIADLLSFALIAMTVVVTLAVYPQLPDPMPIHWNAAGQVDGYLSKPWGVAVLPGTAAFTLLIMKIVMLVSPKKHRTEELDRIMALFQVLLVTFMCAVAVLVLLESLGHNTRLDKMIFGGIGLLLIVIGKNIGKVRKNYFLGIRTPWTMKNDEVWDRTHQLGGKLFMVAGLLMLFNAFVSLYIFWTLAAVALLMLVPVAYSYVVYRQVRASGERDPTG